MRDTLTYRREHQGQSSYLDHKDKLLLRWKLDDGAYRVIYGDLRSESVAADRLKALESR